MTSTAFKPVFRLTVYADDSRSSPLYPPAGSYHNDPFRYTTAYGISGSQPYLFNPQGRRGTLEPLQGTTSNGNITAEILDKKLPQYGDNAHRHVTAFYGDTTGNQNLLGKPAGYEISTDGGATWAAFFAGRITDMSLPDAPRISLTIEDSGRELGLHIAVGRPYISASTTTQQSFFPVGLQGAYGPFTGSHPLSASVQKVSAGPYVNHTASLYATLNTALLPPPYSLLGLTISNAYNFRSKTFYDLVSGLPTSRTAIVNSLIAAFGGAMYLGAGTANITNPSGSTTFALRLSSGSLIGEYGIQELDFAQSSPFQLMGVVFTPITGSDPFNKPLSAFPIGSSVGLRVVPKNLPIDTNNPLFIGTLTLPTFAYDVARGYYGLLYPDTGKPISNVLVDDARFQAMINDPTWGELRIEITQAMTIKDLWSKVIAPYGLGYRMEPRYSGSLSGSVIDYLVPVDNRIPAVSASLATIAEADVADYKGIQQSSGKPINSITVTAYDELPIPLPANADKPKMTTPWLVDEVGTEPTIFYLAQNAAVNGQSLTIDALGVRVPDRPYRSNDPLSINAIVAQNNPWQQRGLADGEIMDMANYYIQRFGTGATVFTVPCRRSANTIGMQVGDWVYLNISVIPDPTTHQRGGTRLVQIIERQEKDSQVIFKLMDSGKNVVTPVPTWGGVSASVNMPSSALTVTLSALTYQTLVIQLASEVTGSSLPVSNSGDWNTKMRVAVPQTGSQSYTLNNLAGGTQYFIRAKATANNGERDSDWVYPNPNSFILPNVVAPISASFNSITPTSVTVSWNNNGDSASLCEVLLASPSTGSLFRMTLAQGGTTSYNIRGLSIDSGSNPYLFAVRHRDANGGMSVTASCQFTLSGSTQYLQNVSRIYQASSPSFNPPLAK